MTPNEYTQFAKLMLICAEKYNRPFGPAFIKLYWHSLQAFSLPDVKRAFETHFNNPDNGHFLPHQSDILRILQGDSETQSLLAWSKVMDAIKKLGAYQSIVFDDLLIHAVLYDMGGWIYLCRFTAKALTFSRYEFQKRYCGYLLRRPEHYPNHLIGLIEHQNQQYGCRLPTLQLFGDSQAAMLTFSEGLEPTTLHAQKITPMHLMPTKELSDALQPKKPMFECIDSPSNINKQGQHHDS